MGNDDYEVLYLAECVKYDRLKDEYDDLLNECAEIGDLLEKMSEALSEAEYKK